jgi:hypothetical protein
MAKYYGILPSIVAAQASTYDLMVYDLSLAWEQQQHDKAMGVNTVPTLKEEDLMKIMAEHRSKLNGG